MDTGPRNLLTDVQGLLVGHAGDGRTGCTVVTGHDPFVAGVHVMGGAPGTRETDLLAPSATVAHVDALVLSGGSAFGLASAQGVVAGLAAQGRGFETAGRRVPIVPAAILFDLAASPGPAPDWPTLGADALAAAGADFALGSVGAGAGALVAGLRGGLGSASAALADGSQVAALVAVNAAGQVTVGEGPHFWAAPFEIGDEFGGLGPAPYPCGAPRTKRGPMATTLAVVATDMALDKAAATRLATVAHDGMARAIVPSHTPVDGDLVFAVSTGLRPPPDATAALWLGHAAATCLARAIARGVFLAAAGGESPSWRECFGPS